MPRKSIADALENQTLDTVFDWPRIIEGYSDYVEKWLKSEVEK